MSKISQYAAAQSPLAGTQQFILTQAGTPDVNLTWAQLVAEIWLAVGGTAAQFVKGNGTLDNSVYLTSNGLPDIYDAAGFVGVNQPAPAYTFDVLGDVNFTGTLYQNGLPFGGGGGTGNWTFSGDTLSWNSDAGTNMTAYAGGNLVIAADACTANIGHGDNSILLNISGTAGFAMSASNISLYGILSQPIVLNPAGGFVGIAQPSPLFTLDVAGDVNASVNYYSAGVQGFTGTGIFTNFTISGGIITAAS